MNVLNVILGLFMGLVIQLSQMPPCAAGSSRACETKAAAMSCCDGCQSCPCAKEGQPAEKPAPAVPTTIDLKLLVAKSIEIFGFDAPNSPPTDPPVVTAALVETHGGFSGVPLSVAFCTFVI